MPANIVVLADDLSGAVALGAEFRQTGRAVRVVDHDASFDPDASEILVVNTDSRDDPPGQAARKNRDALRRLAAVRPDWLVKKIDSLLRGHIGAEIAALLAGSGRQRCLIAPAAPQSGRTTVNGRQCFAGRPLGEQIGNMDRNAVLDTDDVARILARGTDLPVGLLPLELVRQGPGHVARRLETSGEPLVVADAETQDDLDTVVAAAAAAGIRFVAGTYGIGAAVLSAGAAAGSGLPILAVAGSTSMLTRQQTLYAGSRPSCALVTLALGKEVLEREPEAVASPYHAVLREHFLAGRNVVLRTYADATEMRTLREAAQRRGWEPVRIVRHIEACIAETVRPALGYAGGLVVSGGATASAIFRAAGATSFVVEGPEVIPASPVVRLANGTCRGLPCLIKPGAFGEEGDVFAMIRFLRLYHPVDGESA